ncbi:hypothetical protein N7462_009440 [Penicillium macrosclerotiorum]|uniref:uncharacterized protein n=1 Tax=Penicillium macrosclerotiorum TaxID=303699 RepID=UPI002546F0B3|nr:uncharacterized protein N7462_009440 [Penicillium macrosclerotiorum]KAJ5674001.1 hypothetical protein N7462_009440 [Penicillium macrosclerotiorum]
MASKKPSHLSLDSFETPAAPKEIQIYTDSRDRIPVSVAAMKTPFAAKIEKDSPGKWASKRSTNEPSSSSHDSPVTIVYHPNDSDNEDTKKSITQDGMTMIFRGKKVYNKFEEEEDDGDDEMGLFAARPDLLDDSDDLLSSVQPLSRNSIKPRVLFPSQKPQDQDQSVHEEEAATDDEDGYEADPQSPLADSKSPVFTPQSPEFPRAPGATRLLRSNARFGSQLDLTPTVSASSDAKRKRISPFDQWLRKKQSPEDTAVPTTPKKREADRSGSPVAPPSAKKTRSTRGAVVPLV